MKNINDIISCSEDKFDSINVWGYVTACDPGCNHVTSFHGEVLCSEAELGMDVTYTIKDPWWKSSINPRFGVLKLTEMQPGKVTFQYANRTIVVERGKTVKVDQVPLDYAYAELYVSMKNNLYKQEC